jgi:predicted TPR repeat methyltransferase
MDKAEADALFQRAVDHQQSGRLDAAQPLYEQILASHPGYPHVPHLLGVIVSQRGDWFLARRLIESWVLRRPDDTDALANLAWVHFNLGLPLPALERCGQALALDDRHARAWLTRGLAQQQLGQHEEALASFDQALAVQPGLLQALNGRGQCLHALQRYDEALQSYDAALQLDANFADAHNNQGCSLTGLERRQEAMQSFRRALQLRPRFPQALFNLGLALQAGGQYEEALGHYEAALALLPDYPEALMYRAFALHRLQRSPQACLASLDRALALRPSYFEALNGRASILGHLDQFAEALADYDKALALRPDAHEVHLNRGHVLRELGRLGEAAAAYRETLRLGGDAETAQFALAALGQGEAPRNAPASYIAGLFDRYAWRFDEHLVGRLQYQAHERVCEAMLRLAPPPGDILDLGCGTGLCAPLLQPVARSLTGVDLSPNMIEAARQRGLYQRLECADIADFLVAAAERSQDLVVSTDVFIYVGDLERVFAGVRKCLRPGGLFGFSIEAADAQDVVLLPTRRYAHSPGYIRRLAAAHGFEVLGLEPVSLRKEQEQDLPGYIAVLRARLDA